MNILAKGIDVSTFQGDINWNLVKASGVEFAILRSGFGVNCPNQIDDTFYNNVKGCQAVNLLFGTYHYSYAISKDEAKQEADFCLEIIKGIDLQLPVAYDLEDKVQAGLDKQVLTDIAIAFCNKIRQAGYKPMVYASLNWLENKLDTARIEAENIDIWVAQYYSECQYNGNYAMWQYASDGTVDGITGRVDMDYCYVDYNSKQNTQENVQELEKPKYVITSETNDMGQRGANPELLFSMIYDKKIAELQEKMGRDINGLADLGLYQALVNGEYCVHEGDNDWFVRWVQERLSQWGFDCGYIDGIAGSPTMEGIAKFQRHYGLGEGYLGGTDLYYLIEM